MNNRKPIFGVGQNDASYSIRPKKNGELCPYYVRWHSMLRRCYSSILLERQPTYAGCSVCKEWLTFSNFKSWMEKQDWAGNQLDKDLLVSGNKVYSPDTCVFVSGVVNKFLTDHKASRGDFPIGVCYDRHVKKFRAQCSNPFTGKRGHLGYFVDVQSAYQAWLKKKQEFAVMLANIQTDSRVAFALRSKYNVQQ